MNLSDVVNSLYKLSKGHKINGKVQSKQSIKELILRCQAGQKELNKIEMNDGSWLFEIIYDPSFGYDYYIPDTRDKENALAL